MKTCPNCKSTVSDTAKFCVKCGFNIKKYEENAAQEHFCPECGTKFSGGSFCPECGTSIGDQPCVGNESFDSIGSFDFSALESEAQEQLEEQNRRERIAADFEIENGTLIKYKGTSGDVIIPKEVKHIKKGAFVGFSGLKSIRFEDNSTIQTIDDGAFAWKSDVIDIYITNLKAWCELTDHIWYKKNLYLNNSPVTRLEIPYSGTTIPRSAHFGYNNVTEIIIPNGVTHISDGAFGGCQALSSITIPNSVTHVGNYSFEGCTRLSSITLSNNVTFIGYGAFDNCYSLTAISIPNSVCSIGSGAFRSCTSLTNVSIAGSVTSFDVQIFYGCTGLRSVTLGEGITHLSKQMFDGCSNLRSINLPSSLTTIEDFAFINCGALASITIPDSVTSIGTRAFDGCYSLADVTVGRNSRLSPEELYNKINRTALKRITLPQRFANYFNSNRYYNNFEVITY